MHGQSGMVYLDYKSESGLSKYKNGDGMRADLSSGAGKHQTEQMDQEGPAL